MSKSSIKPIVSGKIDDDVVLPIERILYLIIKYKNPEWTDAVDHAKLKLIKKITASNFSSHSRKVGFINRTFRNYLYAQR